MREQLTQKQENFALNIFKGMKQIDAYIEAGYSSKGKRSSIDTLASILVNKPEIKARLEELRKGPENEAIATVEERKEKATEVIRKELPKKVTARERIMAISELNKMEKIYTEKEPAGEVYQTFFFILPDGTRVLPNQLRITDATE